MKIAIALEQWKLPTFERVLREHGYTWENIGPMGKGELADIICLKVETEDPAALANTVHQALKEAYRSKMQ